MRILATVLASLMLATICFGQGTMNPVYSSYVTDSIDGVNYYQTVIVDGSTNGGCTFTVVCGPNGQTCQFTDWTCANARHYAEIENTVGTAGGTYTSPYQSPFSYMSVQTTTSIPLSSLTNGQEVPTRTKGKAVCTVLGVIAAVQELGKLVETQGCGVVKFISTDVDAKCDGTTQNNANLRMYAVPVNQNPPNVNLHASVNSVLPDALTMDLAGGVIQIISVPPCSRDGYMACFAQKFTMHGIPGNPKPSGDLRWDATACGTRKDVLEHAVCK